MNYLYFKADRACGYSLQLKINLDNNAYIKKNSFGSIAHQGAKGLNLSKNATILVNPNLYIDEYDVMASHGVAMGSLNKDDLKLKIASKYNLKRVEVFENYINLILDIRNTCAHGNIVFDFTPIKSIRKGPALMHDVAHNQNLRGTYKIIEYIVKQISINRYNDLREEMRCLLEKYSDFTRVKDIIQNISGLTEKDFV